MQRGEAVKYVHRIKVTSVKISPACFFVGVWNMRNPWERALQHSKLVPVTQYSLPHKKYHSMLSEKKINIKIMYVQKHNYVQYVDNEYKRKTERIIYNLKKNKYECINIKEKLKKDYIQSKKINMSAYVKKCKK